MPAVPPRPPSLGEPAPRGDKSTLQAKKQTRRDAKCQGWTGHTLEVRTSPEGLLVPRPSQSPVSDPEACFPHLLGACGYHNLLVQDFLVSMEFAYTFAQVKPECFLM